MKNILLLLPTLVLYSCSSEVDQESIWTGDVQYVSVSYSDAEEDDITRSNLVYNNGIYNFSWANGDVIGICPSEGDQLSFSIPLKDVGSKFASFDGGGWSMKSAYTYTAYYPFNREMFLGDLSTVPISYLGQTQTGNSSTEHLGAYDYSISEPQQVNSDGGISFSLQRISAILRFSLTLPEAGSFSQLIVSSDNKPFITKGTFDARNGSKVVTPIEASNTLTLYLNDVSTTQENKTLNLYALTCPQDFTSSKLTFRVLSTVSNGAYKEYVLENAATITNLAANGSKNYVRPSASSLVPNAPFIIVDHPVSDYPYPPQDGITGSAPDFVPVGGSTNQPD